MTTLDEVYMANLKSRIDSHGQPLTEGLALTWSTANARFQPNPLKTIGGVSIYGTGNIELPQSAVSAGEYFTKTVPGGTDAFAKGDLVFLSASGTAKKHSSLGTTPSFGTPVAETSIATTGTNSYSRVYTGRLRTSYNLVKEEGRPFRVWQGTGSAIYVQVGTESIDGSGNVIVTWGTEYQIGFGASWMLSVEPVGYNKIAIAGASNNFGGSAVDFWMFIITISATGSIADNGYYNVTNETGVCAGATVFDITPAANFVSGGTCKFLLSVIRGNSTKIYVITQSTGAGSLQGSAVVDTATYGGDASCYGAQMQQFARTGETTGAYFYLNTSKYCIRRDLVVGTSGGPTNGGTNQITSSACRALSARALGVNGTTVTVGLSLAYTTGSTFYAIQLSCFKAGVYSHASVLSITSANSSTDVVNSVYTNIKSLGSVTEGSGSRFNFLVYTRNPSFSLRHAYLCTSYDNGSNSVEVPTLLSKAQLTASPYNYSFGTSTQLEGSYSVFIAWSGASKSVHFMYSTSTTAVATQAIPITLANVYDSTYWAGVAASASAAGTPVTVIYQGLVKFSEFTNFPTNLAANSVVYANGNNSLTTTSGGGTGSSTQALGRTDPKLPGTNSLAGWYVRSNLFS